MKKDTQLLLFSLLFCVFSLKAKNKIDSTSHPISKWVFKVGVNFVDNSGETLIRNPFNSSDKLAFGDFSSELNIPFKIDTEYRFNESFGFGLSGSTNQWIAGKGIIDGELLTENQNYFAIDANLKVYVDELFNRAISADWIDLSFNLGIGYFKINEGGASFNYGPEINLWLSESIGINFGAQGKVALKSEPKLYDTNHLQYSFGLAYRFKDKNINKDIDNDGILDINDDCPNLFGSIAKHGCPDDLSLENNTEEIIKKQIKEEIANLKKEIITNEVTIIDTDGDGIIDSVDNCPTIIGLPIHNGCPISDTDGDGIIDSIDECPKTVGIASNNGCPTSSIEENNAKIKKISKRIEFDPGKSIFTQKTYLALQDIISYLNEFPNSKFRIEGHTDNIGSYESNRILSQKRADAVKEYLINNGIPAYNLEAIGKGEIYPLETNMYKSGRRVNRRVEIIQIH